MLVYNKKTPFPTHCYICGQPVPVGMCGLVDFAEVDDGVVEPTTLTCMSCLPDEEVKLLSEKRETAQKNEIIEQVDHDEIALIQDAYYMSHPDLNPDENPYHEG